MHTYKPDAPSVARNREPILEVLREHLGASQTVLEIGSGTGQHAIYFAENLPHLSWQTSDCPAKLPDIAAWLAHAALPNTPAPLALDITAPWPTQHYDAVFSANTLHIMDWAKVEHFFRTLPTVLESPGRVLIYGPFKRDAQFGSPSNAAFDQWLKARGAHQGIRDVEAVCTLATQYALHLIEDRPMPANNRCLIWRY